MIGEPSDFSPLDLLGSLGLNAIATHTAIKRGNGMFRLGIKVKGDVPAWTDYRFLVGSGAAMAAQFANSHTLRRVGHDVASGLLNSYVATETARAIGVQEEVGRQQAAASVQAQLPAPPPAEMAPAAQDVEAMGYDFGW